MAMFDASTFKVDTRLRPDWGGGHTHETLPGTRGWVGRPAYKDGPLLIGQRGKQGCATIRRMGHQLDVALYCETPEEVIAAKCKLDCPFVQIDEIGGWGLKVIQLVEAHRQQYQLA